jgi:hypothetical protein
LCTHVRDRVEDRQSASDDAGKTDRWIEMTAAEKETNLFEEFYSF